LLALCRAKTRSDESAFRPAHPFLSAVRRSSRPSLIQLPR